MNIPINIPLISKDEIRAVMSVLRDGTLTSAANSGGERVREFEDTVSSFVGSKYTVAVNSGTAALQAALYALDIKAGDQVLVPSFTFVATANAVMSVGAKPIFVDIRRENYTIDCQDLIKKITKKTRAIIPVHLYGNIANIEQLAEISHAHNIPIIEDAAQALGSTYKQRHAGTFFEMGCFSMYPAKVMTAGEGGFITTDNKRLYQSLRMIRNHGMIKGYDTKVFGLNLRLGEIGAAIATVQMKRLPKFLVTRRRNAKLFTKLLSDLDITLPSPRENEEPNWYLYTISSSKRNKIQRHLNRLGIGAAPYYSTPVHKTPLYSSTLKLVVTDWAAEHVLSLPIHPKVTIQNVQYIADSIHDAL